MKSNFTIVIHGGAGNVTKKNLSHEREIEYRDKMTEVLELGYDMLLKGGTAIDVVETGIKIMEDSPLFNAGKGSVFTHAGRNEMDAAIMNGKTLEAGAVAGVRTIKNPISAAKAVMEKSKFVLLSGRGAEQFAKKHKIEIVDKSYFFDQMRWQQLLKIRNSGKTALDHSDTTGTRDPDGNIDKYGTVGCVVLDRHGNLAAGTSTGGLVNTRYNRIGDSPLIGAGTYANNETCAVSCTGHGEDFIRQVAAYDVSALMEYKNMTLKEATYEVIMNKMKRVNGRGGLIAVDSKGNFSMLFNTEGMFRGYADNLGNISMSIYNED